MFSISFPAPAVFLIPGLGASGDLCISLVGCDGCCGTNCDFGSGLRLGVAWLSLMIMTLLPGKAKQFEQTRAFLLGSILSSLAVNSRWQLLHCITKRLKSWSMGLLPHFFKRNFGVGGSLAFLKVSSLFFTFWCITWLISFVL